jgi:methionyl-tRNA formyltransferase
MKIIFMGTPEFAVPILETLIKNYGVRAVVTQPDRILGRKKELTPPPVKVVAEENAILVLQPENIKEDYEEIINLEPDLIVTAAYGQIIPRAILDLPKYGCINVHASLLPKLRGGAPIHRAIMNGHTKTGITIMYMNDRMDQGDIIKQKEISINDTDTYDILHDKLKVVGSELIIEVINDIINGKVERTPQNHDEATYGLIIRREDERIDFNQSKHSIYNKIRGLNSNPGAYCLYKGNILKVYESYITDSHYPQLLNGEVTNIYSDGFGVKVSNGEIVLKTVQPAGKNKMSALDFVRGNQDFKKGSMLE